MADIGPGHTLPDPGKTYIPVYAAGLDMLLSKCLHLYLQI